MSLDERARHELYEQLDRSIGTESADTLMAHLPPVGWADVATKQDLDHVTDVLTLRMDMLAAEIRAEVQRALRQQLWGIRGGLMGAVFLSELLGGIG